MCERVCILIEGVAVGEFFKICVVFRECEPNRWPVGDRLPGGGKRIGRWGVGGLLYTMLFFGGGG